MDPTLPPTSDADWLMPAEEPAPPADEIASPPPPRSGLRLAKATALLAAGLVVGGGVALAAGHDSSTPSAGSTVPSGAVVGAPGGTGGPGAPGGAGAPGLPGGAGGPGDRGFGGLPGEQHVQGTLTAVGSSTVTVKSPAGTATYRVVSTTQIVRNGAVTTLGQLEAGDPVLVHVYPSGSGGGLVVERILAGTLPSFGDRDGDHSGGPPGP